MSGVGFDALLSQIRSVRVSCWVGRVAKIGRGVIGASGLSRFAAFGDIVEIVRADGDIVRGEILGMDSDRVTILTDGSADGIQIDDVVRLVGSDDIAPDDAWLGKIIDPFGKALDGSPLLRGERPRPLFGNQINPSERRGLGGRLETGLTVFNTLLPIVRGQRIGLFAGSGVGKTTLMGQLAIGLQADVVIVAMIGERGREVREFAERVVGPTGMARTIIVAATSDQSALTRRRCAWTAMSIAEHFRDSGKHVLFIADSITRFADAHREVALATGEASQMRGYPASTTHLITSLCERAGPGVDNSNDITAVFSVLVAGSDMEEPIADILRGVLDGHVVLEREIAERGRFPAVNLLRSVSRSLPFCATEEENSLIMKTREVMGTYDRNEMMIRAGLYTNGADDSIDAAIEVWPKIDRFLGQSEFDNTADSFKKLASCLERENSTQNSSHNAPMDNE